MSGLTRLLPHNLVAAFNERRVYQGFAETNGLVYFGAVDSRSDDHTTVRGFTMSARTRDEHVMSGTVGDHDVTILRRTDSMAGRAARPVTWVIASVTLHKPVPPALVMSDGYPRDVYEAAFIGLVRSEHIALDYRLDANFLIYARPADVADLRASLNEQTVSTLLSRPQHDYEFIGDTLNVCMHANNSALSVLSLSGLLYQALAVADAYEKDLR